MNFLDMMKKKPLLLYLGLLVFGLITSLFIIRPHWSLSGEAPFYSYMSIRVIWLEQVMEQFGDGVWRFEQEGLRDHGEALYFWLALGGRIFGVGYAPLLFFYAQMGMAIIGLTVFPMLMYRLMKSTVVAVVSPFLVSFFASRFLWEQKTDISWGLSWVMLVGIPLIAILIAEKWTKKSWPILIVLFFTIAIGNVVRNQAALPLLVLAFFTVIPKLFYKVELRNVKYLIVKNLRLLAAVTLLVMSSDFLTRTIPFLISPSIIGTNIVISRQDQFGPWHTLYIGLGWDAPFEAYGVPDTVNRHGIIFSDDLGWEHVLRVDSTVVFQSPEYMNIIRNLYFQLWRDDPMFVIDSYMRKFTANIKMLINHVGNIGTTLYTGPLFAWFAVLLFFKNYDSELSKEPLILLFVSVFCAVLGLAQGMVALPTTIYIMGSLTAIEIGFVALSILLFRYIIKYMDLALLTSTESNTSVVINED